MAIGSVWIFHGLYSKILAGIPRHRLIVDRILGEGIGDRATLVIGTLEMLLGLWVFSGLRRVSCATVQTLAIVSMNTLEILLARELLISAAGMVLLNLTFLGTVWFWQWRITPGNLSRKPTRLAQTASCKKNGERRPNEAEPPVHDGFQALCSPEMRLVHKPLAVKADRPEARK